MSRLNSSIVFVILILVFILTLLVSAYQTGILWISIFFIILSVSIISATIKIMTFQSFGVKWDEYPKSILMIVIGAFITFYLADRKSVV